MDALTLLDPGCQAKRPDAPFHKWSSDGKDWTRFYRNETGILMQFPGLADFQLSLDGKSASCRPTVGADHATLDHLYQNQVLPMILSLKGKHVFHGAAIEHEEGAIAFLGPSGRGKSLLAASFAVSGHQFLSDDLLVLEPHDNTFEVLPGAPSVRLWSDARKALLGDQCELAAPVNYTDKERVLATVRLPQRKRPLPLRVGFVLGEDKPEVSARYLFGADLLAAWMAHVFVLEVDKPASIQQVFANTAEIASSVPTVELSYPRDYEQLQELRRAILAEVSALSKKKETSLEP